MGSPDGKKLVPFLTLTHLDYRLREQVEVIDRSHCRYRCAIPDEGRVEVKHIVVEDNLK